MNQYDGTAYQPGQIAHWPYYEDVTLVAQWGTQTYQINYEKNGGVGNCTPTEYTFGLGAQITCRPTRTNSVFDGWCKYGDLTECATTQSVGTKDYGDKTFWAKWICEHNFVMNDYGECVPCPSGSHAENGECEPNVIYCNLPDAELATRTWNPTVSAYGACQVVNCNEGYHNASNVCVLDSEDCVVPNGVGRREWNDSTLQWGKCEAILCNPGFVMDNDVCVECSNRIVDGEVAVSTYANGCEIATCMYQGQKYKLSGNQCVPICENGFDDTGTMTWDSARGKCVRTCNPGYKMW